MGFYYAIALAETSPFLDLSHDQGGVERGRRLLLRWFPVEVAPDLPLVPDFLRTALGKVPNSPQPFVLVDIDCGQSSSAAQGGLT